MHSTHVISIAILLLYLNVLVPPSFVRTVPMRDEAFLEYGLFEALIAPKKPDLFKPLSGPVPVGDRVTLVRLGCAMCIPRDILELVIATLHVPCSYLSV